jgi:plastocyanin
LKRSIHRVSLVAAATVVALLAPAAAHAAPPPLSASYTANDISATNHQWYITGTTTTASTIATSGTVTWSYPTGNTRHDVNFTSALKPTQCQVNGGATATPPVPKVPTAPGWTGSCTFTTPGTYTFACTLHPTMTGSIVVTGTSDAAPVGGAVPATLSFGIGTSASLGTFVLGVAADYTATLDGLVTSTAGDGLLTVADPSATATGHLVNGPYVMVQPLQAKATNAANPTSAFAPIPGSASPLTLLTWGGPVSNDAINVAFKQSIGPTDPLRTGSYAKTLVFTLSTTNP